MPGGCLGMLLHAVLRLLRSPTPLRHLNAVQVV